jgi:hypothetical protein
MMADQAQMEELLGSLGLVAAYDNPFHGPDNERSDGSYYYGSLSID